METTGRFSKRSSYFFYFTQWKLTDTRPRDRCSRAQLVLLPSLADFFHLGAEKQEFNRHEESSFVFWGVGRAQERERRC